MGVYIYVLLVHVIKDDITNVIYSSFSKPSYIFFSTKNNSFTFVSDNLNMATALNLDDLTIKTIFKNSRNNSYFENIQEGKNADKFMIYNKNEKECWASIATLPSQVKSIIDHNREIVNKSDLKRLRFKIVGNNLKRIPIKY